MSLDDGLFEAWFFVRGSQDIHTHVTAPRRHNYTHQTIVNTLVNSKYRMDIGVYVGISLWPLLKSLIM